MYETGNGPTKYNKFGDSLSPTYVFRDGKPVEVLSSHQESAGLSVGVDTLAVTALANNIDTKL